MGYSKYGINVLYSYLNLIDVAMQHAMSCKYGHAGKGGILMWVGFTMYNMRHVSLFVIISYLNAYYRRLSCIVTPHAIINYNTFHICYYIKILNINILKVLKIYNFILLIFC